MSEISMSELSRREGKKFALYLLLAFLVVLAVNAVMVTVAIKSFTGLTTDHPYEKGIAYNKVVAAEEAQEKLGWQGNIAYENGVVSFTLKDKGEKAIKPEKTTVEITRPTQAGMDFSVELVGGKAEVQFPAKGLWELRAKTSYKGNDYQISKRIVVE